VNKAIEGLCVATTPPTNLTAYFQFNTTGDDVGIEPPNPGATGLLTYSLDIGSENVSSVMEFSISVSSNVAQPIFQPSDSLDNGALVAFDGDGKMNIQSYIDDTVYPQVEETVTFYRWYACITDFLGYQYRTLAWMIGPGQPENPTCVKVDVLRVFG